jgi:septation ring formation regulator EzrA
MSQNKIPTNLTSVEKLVQRLVAAERSNQKEIRMSIQEARDIVTDLSIMTSKLGKNIEEIHAKLDKIVSVSSEITVQVDGGNF